MTSSIPPETANSPTYNQVYDRLVQSDDDIVGLVAYDRYKQHKRGWLFSFKEKHGGPPTDKDVESFILGQLLPKQLEALRRQAEIALDDITIDAISQAKPRHYQEAITERIEAALSFRSNVWAGMTAALLYTLALILVSFILHYAGVDLLSIWQATAGARGAAL